MAAIQNDYCKMAYCKVRPRLKPIFDNANGKFILYKIVCLNNQTFLFPKLIKYWFKTCTPFHFFLVKYLQKNVSSTDIDFF